MKRIILILSALAAGMVAAAQKPSLDHSVYDNWKSTSAPLIQDGGDWARYTVSPQEGDNVLHVYNVVTGKEYTMDRVSKSQISKDGTKLVATVKPLFQQTRQAKIDKKKEDEMPKDSLAVLDLRTGAVNRFAEVKAVNYPEKLGSYVAFTSARKDNDTLYVLNIHTMAIDSIAHVKNVKFPREKDIMAYTTTPGKKDSLTMAAVYLYNPADRTTVELLKGEQKSTFENLNFNDDASRLAFFAALDTAKTAAKNLDLYLYSDGKLSKLVEHKAPFIRKGWELGQKAEVIFYKDHLTFGTRPIPMEKDTTLVEFEQAKLDIWVWNEDYIQTIQKHNVNTEKERTYLARIGYDGTGFAQLADPEIPEIRIGRDNEYPYILASTDKPYRVSQQWDYRTCTDLYVIDRTTGGRKLVSKAVPFSSPAVSPDGRWCASFDEALSAWFITDTRTGQMRNVTDGLGVSFADEENDRPMDPDAYGSARWSEDSDFLWIPDRYDIWQFDPTGARQPFKVTDGRPTKTRYNYLNAYNRTGERIRGISLGQPVYFTTFNETTKMTGISRKDFRVKKARMEDLSQGPYTYANLSVKPGKKPVVMYTRGNFEDGTNIWMSQDGLKTELQLSDINPQQRDYNWGTVELVSWNAADGTPAEGLLFKPENFDPSRKYPVMIYFYERYSDDLYAARVPAPSASTVNVPYFVSNEYIFFIPDIRYKDGHPGKSCMDYIMPACDMLCEYPWIDGDNMAIQGQSWGGYQVAYIITQTGRFKAAGAGAPVSNMTSAYGGIRWESGVARTAQYEDGQSRIGKDLWDGFDLYVENSPLFHIPNVTTPVLIMHNDADGAVPWWQGIEFFNGLRRCGKQAWMLQYNDEAHNLKERRNRKDLSIRLSQFFDHFLKGAPAPVWMTRGVPATEKGLTYGFEYDE